MKANDLTSVLSFQCLSFFGGGVGGSHLVMLKVLPGLVFLVVLSGPCGMPAPICYFNPL